MKQWLAATCTEDVKKFYDEKYAKNGLEQFKDGNWEIYKRLLQEVGGKFNIEKRLLDAGCGHGEFLNSVCHQVISYGIELSPTAVALAEKRVQNRSKIYTLAIEDIRPDSWEPFDYVTCFGVLEHSMHPVDNFKILYSLAKPSGCLLIVVPLEFENCLSAIEQEENRITNERFMTADEWINLFGIKPTKTEVINKDVALVYKH